MIKIKIKKKNKLSEQEQFQKKVLIRDLVEDLKKYKDCICVVYDLETTGFNPSIHQITQIGAQIFEFKVFEGTSSNIQLQKTDLNDFEIDVRLTQETIKLAEQPFIKTKENEKSIKDVLQMTGYDISKSHTYEEEKIAINNFFTYLNKLSKDNRKVILIGQNIINFDNKFISKRAQIYNLNPLDNDVLDTVDLMKNIYYPLLRAKNSTNVLDKIKMPDGRHTFSLGVIAKALDIDNKNWHRALDDVKMLMLVVGKVLNEINTNLDLDITDAQLQIAKEKEEREKAKLKKSLTENKKYIVRILRNT